jgi:hypothetical protein
MAASLFKTQWVPNQDGTDSTTPCNSSNAAFVHTYLGDDLTGDGTREYPFRSVNKALQKSGISYVVFRGVVNEYFSANKTLIGDDINQNLITSNYGSLSQGLIRMTLDSMWFPRMNTANTVFNIYGDIGGAPTSIISYSLVKHTSAVSPDGGLKNITAFNLSVVGGYYNYYFNINSIVIGSLNVILDNGYLKYCIFPSSCVFQHNGVAVATPTWTNDPKANVQLLRNAYVSAGMSSANALTLFHQDSFGNETCQVVWEQRNGGTLPNIFNAYNPDGSVADYTLNPDIHNVALWASDIGGYVGFLKPAETISMSDSIINVNADGSDDTTSGNLLQLSTSGLIFNNLSTQTWNRMRSNAVIYIPNGSKLKGAAVMSQDGSPFGNYFGKLQPLIDTVQVNPGDTLIVGTWYKVLNDTAKSIDYSILYNGSQYLPEYTFLCVSAATTFSLLNSWSGSYVKKIIADPLESIEILPYDNPATPSAFPPFSAPLMGDVKLLFYTAAGASRYGAVSGNPVLFSHLANSNFAIDFPALVTNKIVYYNNYAISNADQEYVQLGINTIYFSTAIPTLSYFKTELNAHLDVVYDY